MGQGVLARQDPWILDGQTQMSKESGSSDCEDGWRLRENEVRSNRLLLMSAKADMSVL